MSPSLRAAAVLLLGAAVCLPAPLSSQVAAVPSIRRVRVLDSRNQVEIEIETSDRVVPQINVLTGPDRLVVDFVNAVPGPQLRNQPVNRGEVKSLRVGLFSVGSAGHPGRPRFEWSAALPGFSVGKKCDPQSRRNCRHGSGQIRCYPGAALVNANYAVQAMPASAPAPPPVKPLLEVSFQSGLLSISSNKASLSEILSAVHRTHRGGDRHSGRRGAGKGHGRDSARLRLRKFWLTC